MEIRCNDVGCGTRTDCIMDQQSLLGMTSILPYSLSPLHCWPLFWLFVAVWWNK